MLRNGHEDVVLIDCKFHETQALSTLVALSVVLNQDKQDQHYLDSQRKANSWAHLSLAESEYLRVKAEVCVSPSSPGSPAVLMPNVRIPKREERRLLRQWNSQKGKFITDSSQGSCHIQRSGAGSESPEPKLLPKFIGGA